MTCNQQCRVSLDNIPLRAQMNANTILQECTKRKYIIRMGSSHLLFDDIKKKSLEFTKGCVDPCAPSLLHNWFRALQREQTYYHILLANGNHEVQASSLHTKIKQGKKKSRAFFLQMKSNQNIILPCLFDVSSIYETSFNKMSINARKQNVLIVKEPLPPKNCYVKGLRVKVTVPTKTLPRILLKLMSPYPHAAFMRLPLIKCQLMLENRMYLQSRSQFPQKSAILRDLG